MSPSVIFENEHFLIINKPSGTVVHPFDFSDEVTLLDFLEQYSPEIFVIENPITLQDDRIINLGGIVHKLDRDTSGVLVVAKTKEALEELRNLFTTQQVQKTYVALVDGVIKEDTLHIDAPLGRNKKDYKQVAYPKNPRGDLREALTDLRVIRRDETTTLVELQPKTGRTHQLRAHMAYIGHPIVGDIAYGSTLSSARIMLHAEKIAFSLFKEEYMFEIKNYFEDRNLDLTK
jgi:23S rRNA pseudouridine1911/1915/1917 synthase